MKIESCYVKETTTRTLKECLIEYNYEVKELSPTILWVKKDSGPIFIEIGETQLYFQKDFGSLNKIGSEDLWFKLLDLNTNIVPVAVGIDTTGGDPRLVLIDSIEAGTLDLQELLGLLDSLEYAEEQVEILLNDALKGGKK